MRLHLVLQHVDLALGRLAVLLVRVDLLLQLPVLLVDRLEAFLLRKYWFLFEEAKAEMPG